MPPQGADSVHAELHRKFTAWREALLGVRSKAPEQAFAPAPWSDPPVQTPAEQAAFDLRRPGQQIWQPIIIGLFASFYVGMPLFAAGPVAGILGLTGTVGASVLLGLRRKKKQLRQASGRTLNAAFNLIGLGRLTDASLVLDALEARVTEHWALRLADIQRAIIAIRRGDMVPAEAFLTSAIDRPLEGYARENASYQLEGAHALRAFVRAALGKHEEARADIARIESGSASEDARARVTLAEAMILEQQGKREELRELLARKGALLLEHTHPRERAIVRAFQRMVRAGKASVYRRAETRREKPEGEEPMLSDWVARVAPGAAEFVRSPRPADQVATITPGEALAQPTEAALRANREAKQKVVKKSGKSVLIGLASIAGMMAGVFGLLARDEGSKLSFADAAAGTSAAASVAPYFFLALIFLVPTLYAVTRALQWVGRRRAEKQVREGAKGTQTSGPPNEEQLRALTESPSPVVAAQAWLLLADRAERRADFAAVLNHTTNGLARLSDARDRAAADIVYPDLLSLRAFALAAHNRFQEANAELATLGPAYPHFSRAVFRARLLMHVRSGDARGAARWVEQGEADLPLSVREELLADLVRATASPEQAGAGEIQRLKDELASSAETKTWVKVAVPGLLEAFENATMSDLRVRIDVGPEPEHLAEQEADAALEEAAMARAYIGRA